MYEKATAHKLFEWLMIYPYCVSICISEHNVSMCISEHIMGITDVLTKAILITCFSVEGLDWS